MVYAQSYPMSAKVTNSESTKFSTENFKAAFRWYDGLDRFNR